MNNDSPEPWTLKLVNGAKQTLGYSLSLPERSLRSLAALVGGATSLLTDTLLPDALRGSSLYQVTVGLFQAFLVERVAEMERGAPEPALGDKYVQRKVLGNLLEAAGLLTVRLSPLWVFAILGDAAGGSKVFLERLTAQLRHNGVIGPDAEPQELVDVLEAVQQASSRSATALDLPPLSREELAHLADELKASYARVLEGGGKLLANLDELWLEATEVAERDEVALERVLGALTLDAALVLKKGVGTLRAVGETGAALFDEAILESYRRTLSAMRREGVDGYVKSHLEPFLGSAWRHFDPQRRTLTERLLGLGEER